MVPRVLVSLVLCAGCGRLGFDAVSDGAAGDGDPFAPFSAVSVISDLSGAVGDDDPTLTGDMLDIIFDSERMPAAGSDLFAARRTSLVDGWSVPQPIAELASATDEDSPCLASDGKTLTFASDRGGASTNQLWWTTRTDRTSAWATPQVIAELASNGTDEKLCRTADERAGVFASDRSGGAGGFDLYATNRGTATVAWGPVARMTELSSADDDRDPMLSADGTVIVFSSTRSGNFDLYVAVRPDPVSRFGAPVRIDSVTTAADETDPWLSPDGHTLVFTRGSASGRDLYIATR